MCPETFEQPSDWSVVVTAVNRRGYRQDQGEEALRKSVGKDCITVVPRLVGRSVIRTP